MRQELHKYKGKKPVTITTENYMEVMELIYLYPDEFLDRDINTLALFITNRAMTTTNSFSASALFTVLPTQECTDF